MRSLPPPGLVEATVDAKDDVSARLVFADWLQDQGDPGGEWIVASLRGESVDPERAAAGRRALHEVLFAGWPGQHALITWRHGFVRELVVRLPGVSGPQLAQVLAHPTLWLVERVTLAGAQLPLFERGVLDEAIDALVATGPHRRLESVELAGFSLSWARCCAIRRTLGEVAPRLRDTSYTSNLSTAALDWFDQVDRYDTDPRITSLGPFSPGPIVPSFDDADEERLWLEHTEWCDERDEEPA